MPTRRVLAVRHGESTWNVLQKQYPREEQRYLDIMYTPDAPITDLGRSQSVQAGINLTKELGLDESYTLIVSPLRRALQTARYMLSTTKRPPSQIIVHPAAAEVMADACDIGSPVNDLKLEFPEFDDLNKLHDCWWPYGRSLPETWKRMKDRQPGGVETNDMVQARMATLKLFIIKTIMGGSGSTVVVIVCHSDVIWELTKETKCGSVFGIKAENGEVLDITKFILQEENGKSFN